MDDLTALLGGQEKGKDLVDKLINLLDRQTDHKLTPNVLLGFLGLFNVLSIMSVVHGSVESGLKEITGSSEGDKSTGTQALTETLSSLMQGSGQGLGPGGQGSGQPDLLGLLGGLASKKKINPNLLLSLFSMLNNQGAQANPASTPPVESSHEEVPVMSGEGEGEKKSPDEKHGVELRYDRRRGSGERG